MSKKHSLGLEQWFLARGDLPHRRHAAVSRDIFDGHSWWGEVASNGWRPGMGLTLYNAQDGPYASNHWLQMSVVS